MSVFGKHVGDLPPNDAKQGTSALRNKWDYGWVIQLSVFHPFVGPLPLTCSKRTHTLHVCHWFVIVGLSILRRCCMACSVRSGKPKLVLDMGHGVPPITLCVFIVYLESREFHGEFEGVLVYTRGKNTVVCYGMGTFGDPLLHNGHGM